MAPHTDVTAVLAPASDVEDPLVDSQLGDGQLVDYGNLAPGQLELVYRSPVTTPRNLY